MEEDPPEKRNGTLRGLRYRKTVIVFGRIRNAAGKCHLFPLLLQDRAATWYK